VRRLGALSGPMALVIAALAVGCATGRQHRFPSGLVCTEPSVDYRETSQGSASAAGGAAKGWFRHRSESFAWSGKRRDESEQDYRRRLACESEAEHIRFQRCMDHGNGLIDWATYDREARVAAAKCGR
jgi:hypothetical protein